MKLFRISQCIHINDLNGTGAGRFGGRWNSKGNYILYTAQSASLALLETVAHMAKTASTGYCIVCIDVPDIYASVTQPSALPQEWQTSPPPKHLASIGDSFVKEGNALLLKVPSVIMPEEYNYLINPAHPDFDKITIDYTKSLPIDKRLIGND